MATMQKKSIQPHFWMKNIHTNPVRSELVANPEEYLYSSARDYSGEKGLVNIELVFNVSCLKRITDP
jgi:hypothetical protein